MPKPRTAGSQANYTGSQLEQLITQTLLNNGYLLVESSRFRAATYLHQPIFAQQFHIGESIYGSDLNIDFIIYHPEKWPDSLIIEAKWQQEQGSVDEKYPYLVMNLKERCSERSMVVLGGGGCRSGAVRWLKEQMDKQLIHVFSYEEFLAKANRGLI